MNRYELRSPVSTIFAGAPLMTDFTKLTTAALATKLEAAQLATAKAAQRVYDLAANDRERFSQICGRLGNNHTVVAAWRASIIKTTDLESECRRRYGPDAVSHPAHWVTALRTRLRKVK